MEWYHKHRPKQLKQMVGHREVLRTIHSQIKEGTLPHVLLLSGPSGIGKTTLARIVVSKLKCDAIDIRELNSSSFRGIDTVRDLEAWARVAPFNEVKVAILDEVHKWTSDAQHASLKLLEDTPEHTYFILCTTEPNKLISALRGRCCSLVMKGLKKSDLCALANRVVEAEGMEIDESHVDEVVELSEGSARQLLITLERLHHLPKDEWDSALAAGVVDSQEIIDLCRELISTRKWSAVVKILSDLSADPETVRRAVLGYSKSCLMKSKPNPKAYEIIQCFAEPFYDTGLPGLVAACYALCVGA